MLTDDEVTRIVAETVRDQLAPNVVDVRVRKGIDEDGDDVLNIMVVIAKDGCPDRRKMLGLARHIRSNLQHAAATGFPVLSFVSMGDAAKMDFEAA